MISAWTNRISTKSSLNLDWKRRSFQKEMCLSKDEIIRHSKVTEENSNSYVWIMFLCPYETKYMNPFGKTCLVTGSKVLQASIWE